VIRGRYDIGEPLRESGLKVGAPASVRSAISRRRCDVHFTSRARRTRYGSVGRAIYRVTGAFRLERAFTVHALLTAPPRLEERPRHAFDGELRARGFADRGLNVIAALSPGRRCVCVCVCALTRR